MVIFSMIIILWWWGLWVGNVVLFRVGREISGFFGLDSEWNMFFIEWLVNILLCILVSI